MIIEAREGIRRGLAGVFKPPAILPDMPFQDNLDTLYNPLKPAEKVDKAALKLARNRASWIRSALAAGATA